MPSRIATAIVGEPHRLKALIVADPSIIEDGFRVLDRDLRAGPSGVIDLVGVDRSGCLSLVGVAREDADAALVRLLDQHLWAADQRDLLRRLYAGSGLVADLPGRCVLFAPAFGPSLLRRLPLLSVRVTPLLARTVSLRGQGAVLIERAGTDLGADPPVPVVIPASQADQEDGSLRPGRPGGLELEIEAAEPAFEQPIIEAADVAADLPADPPGDFATALDAMPERPTGDAALSDPFEALTAEELQEFERFDQHRRERRGSTP